MYRPDMGKNLPFFRPKENKKVLFVFLGQGPEANLWNRSVNRVKGG
jgi:hypothetical protein